MADFGHLKATMAHVKGSRHDQHAADAGADSDSKFGFGFGFSGNSDEDITGSTTTLQPPPKTRKKKNKKKKSNAKKKPTVADARGVAVAAIATIKDAAALEDVVRAITARLQDTGGSGLAVAPTALKGLPRMTKGLHTAAEDWSLRQGSPEARELAILGVAAEAAKAAIGPKVGVADDARVALVNAQQSLEAAEARTGEQAMDLQHRSRLEHKVAELTRGLAKAEADVEACKQLYNVEIRSKMTTKIAKGLAESAAKFQALADEANPDDLDAITWAVEQLVNTDALAVGDKVTVDAGPLRGRTLAVVDAIGPTPGEYRVLVMREQLILGSKYSQEFDEPMTLPRSKLYRVETAPLLQPDLLGDGDGASLVAKLDALWGASNDAMSDMVELLEGALDAGEANGLGPRPAGIRLRLGPLKALLRGLAKIFEKYNGDVWRLLDVARLTVVCDNEAGIAWALRAFLAAGLDFARIKNRTDRLFKAGSETAGYRDVLGNLRLPGRGGLVVEVQLTTAAMLALKDTEMHVYYRIGRIIAALDRAVWCLPGAVGPAGADRIASGMVCAVEVAGSRVEPAVLLPALAASPGVLRVLDLTACLGLAGRALAEVLTEGVAAALGETLEELSLHSCGVTGPIPACLGRLVRLVRLQLQKNDFAGTRLPEGVFGRMPRLAVLHAHTCGLVGGLPADLAAGGCPAMVYLSLQSNRLEGGLPDAMFAAMPGLEDLRLDDNLLTGPLPADGLKTCTKMKQLGLHGNQFDDTSFPADLLAAMPLLTFKRI